MKLFLSSRVVWLLLLWSLANHRVLAQPAANLTQAIHYIKLASTLRAVNKPEKSVDLLVRALPVTRKGSPYWTAVANETIGLAYNDLRDTDKALYYLELARTQYGKLSFVASGWGVNEVIRDISGKNLYAGIQVSLSGVQIAIFKTSYESDFYEKDIRSVFYIPNGEAVADASPMGLSTRNALAIGVDSIRHYNIPDERVFVIINSDIRDRVAQTPEARKRLYEQVQQLLPAGRAFAIDTTMTTRREAELFTVGAISRSGWPTTSALNLGPFSTTGGYIDQPSTQAPRDFFDIQLGIGIRTLTDRINAQQPGSMSAFRREAQRQVQALVDSSLTPWLLRAPQDLRKRRIVAIAGEPLEALAACLYANRAGQTAVPITAGEVSRFRQMALTDYSQLIRPDLSVITDPMVREKADRQLMIMREKLDEKQLIVSALWLDAVVRAYTVNYGVRQFVFIRNADIGWVTGKFLETINYEYESTIARGEFYTR